MFLEQRELSDNEILGLKHHRVTDFEVVDIIAAPFHEAFEPIHTGHGAHVVTFKHRQPRYPWFGGSFRRRDKMKNFIFFHIWFSIFRECFSLNSTVYARLAPKRRP